MFDLKNIEKNELYFQDMVVEQSVVMLIHNFPKEIYVKRKETVLVEIQT